MFYTSYFAVADKRAAGKTLVSIARTVPPGTQCESFSSLVPTAKLLYDYKNGRVTQREYMEQYLHGTLQYLDPKQVFDAIDGKVLCCWEKADKFCHRHLVASWLIEALGPEVYGGEL